MDKLVPPARPGRHRDDLVHRAILDAAAAILKDEGYGQFTIERVARRAKAGKPTIYRWWPSKTALLIELFDRATTQPLAVDDEGDVSAQLLRWFEGIWRIWQTDAQGEAFRSILAEIQADAAARHYFETQFVPHRRQLLRDILQRGQQCGQLRPGLDLDVIVDYFWGHNWYHLLMRSQPKQAAFRQLIGTVVRAD